MCQVEITRHLELADSLRFIITSRAVLKIERKRNKAVTFKMISLVKVKEEYIINLRNCKRNYTKFYQRFYLNVM